MDKTYGLNNKLEWHVRKQVELSLLIIDVTAERVILTQRCINIGCR
jgi:hypothetical protein